MKNTKRWLSTVETTMKNTETVISTSLNDRNSNEVQNALQTEKGHLYPKLQRSGLHHIDGDFQMVKDFITTAARDCHVELTTLIIPGGNDSEQEMRELSACVATLENQTGKKNPPSHHKLFPSFQTYRQGANTSRHNPAAC